MDHKIMECFPIFGHSNSLMLSLALVGREQYATFKGIVKMQHFK